MVCPSIPDSQSHLTFTLAHLLVTCYHSMTQSINQSSNQSANGVTISQPLNQWTNQAMGQSVNQSSKQWISLKTSIKRSIGQSINKFNHNLTATRFTWLTACLIKRRKKQLNSTITQMSQNIPTNPNQQWFYRFNETSTAKQHTTRFQHDYWHNTVTTCTNSSALKYWMKLPPSQRNDESNESMSQ